MKNDLKKYKEQTLISEDLLHTEFLTRLIIQFEWEQSISPRNKENTQDG